MANFPTSLDNTTTLPNPLGTQMPNSPSHSGLHTNENTAIIALENKLGIGNSNPTSGYLLVGNGAGSSAWSVAAPTGTVVGTTDTQVLTNKTLTSPIINAPTITNANITADSIVGYTTANAGTIYGVSIAGGAITGANSVNGSSLVAGTVGTTALVAGAVQATQIATNAILLGYTTISSNFGTSSTTYAQVTGLSVTVTVPAAGRKVKVTASTWSMTTTTASYINMSVWDGTVGTGTELYEMENQFGGTNEQIGYTIVTPPYAASAGSHTFNIGLKTTAGTANLNTKSNAPAFILVELI